MNVTNSTSLMDRMNPLNLPEIRILIFYNLSKRSLFSCLLVAGSWYASALPLVWDSVALTSAHNGNRNLLFEPLQRHSRLIRSLDCSITFTRRHSNLKCTRLETFSLRNSLRQPTRLLFAFFILNTSLKRLHLSLVSFEGDDSIVWDAVSKLPGLQEIYIRDMAIGKQFWVACTPTLTCLVLGGARFSAFPSDSVKKTLTFPRLKHLEIEIYDRQQFSVLDQLDLYSRCPALQSLSLRRHPLQGAYIDSSAISNELIRILQANTWSKLVDLDIGLMAMTDIDIARMLRALVNPVRIRFSNPNFGPAAFQVLRYHFPTLKHLDFSSGGNFTSQMLIEVLESCPMLLELQGFRVRAKDIIQSRHWACRSLNHLSALIQFDVNQITENPFDIGVTRSALEDLQRQVFKRLSGQSTLTKLDISVKPGGRNKKSLDLRLGKGLELLTTLKDMKSVSLVGTDQLMGFQELEWMLIHWPKLKDVQGEMNTANCILSMQLRDKFRERRGLQGHDTL